ncbi:MAG: DUF2127 domain-containing protein [Patescibacteria group bacterium]
MDAHESVKMEHRENERSLYVLFKWSVIIKGVISLAEVVTGLVLLAIPEDLIIRVVQGTGTWLLGYADNPLIIRILGELTRFGSGAALFVALYLLARGLIKCLLVWGLLRSKLWAYPVSLIVLGAFIVYQAYQIAIAHSIFVIGITLFDLVVVYSIAREWRIAKRRLSPRAP